MTGPQEIECKFEIDVKDVDALVARLSAALGAADPPQRLTSVYFDTHRHRLWKKGLTLRVRQMGDRHIQTVKKGGAASSGLFDRKEWETEIGGSGPDLDAAAGTPVAKILAGHGGQLVPVFETAVERTTWRAAQDGAMVEVALDRGEVRTTAAAQPICEVEFELKGGSRAALFATLQHLRVENWLQPAVQAKSERGFALLDGKAEAPVKATPIALDRTMSTGAAVQVILRGCLRQFRCNVPLLAARRPEPLHQARVGLRRLRSAVALFKPALHDEAYDDIADRLRALSGRFGAARDLDVYLQRVVGPQAVRPDGEPGAGALLAAMRSRREAAYDRLLETVGAPSFRRLMLDLFVWIEAGAWLTTAEPGCRDARQRPIAAFAADLLAAQRRKVRKKGRGLLRLSPAARHRVRIAAKTLRYATDFTASLARRPADKARYERFVTVLEALQADLGDLNDIAVGHGLAEDVAEASKATGNGSCATSAAGHAMGEADGRSETLLLSAIAGRRAVLKARPFWSGW